MTDSAFLGTVLGSAARRTRHVDRFCSQARVLSVWGAVDFPALVAAPSVGFCVPHVGINVWGAKHEKKRSGTAVRCPPLLVR